MSGMDRLTELLPCPFCGNEGSGPVEEALHIMFSEPDWREAAAWSVQCDKCTATMGYSDSEDGAIAAWNRRASQAAPAPSDGLRGKTPTTIAHEMIAELDRMGLSYPPVDAIARALGAALTPAPAQEGEPRHD